jgi:SAM-dependent methyltransferase
MHDHARFNPEWGHRLNNPHRLETQLSDQDLARLLALRGHEDLIDLGSGTGFYTDRVAALTTGVVYAVELQPEMSDLHRARGVPANVRLVSGDITHLSLPPASADVACCIATYHEAEGRLDLQGLARILRPGGRFVIVDWRADAESWEGGPPADVRYSKEEAAGSLTPHFRATLVENLGRFMFAVAAERVD